MATNQKTSAPIAAAPAPSTNRGRKPVPENETPEQRFKRLCDARVSKAIDALESVAKLGAYKGWNMEQKAKILAALDNACSFVQESFNPSAPKVSKARFSV